MRNLGVCSFWFILEVDTSVVETSPQLEESLLSTVNVAPELNCRAPVWYLRRNYFLGDDISPPHRSACVDGWEHSQRSGWFSLFHPVTFSLSQSLILTSPYTEVIQESPDDILYQCHLFMWLYFFIFWESISRRLGWPQTCYTAEVPLDSSSFCLPLSSAGLQHSMRILHSMSYDTERHSMSIPQTHFI